MEKYDGVILKPTLDEALEHYGVKGMKWRKKHPRITSRENRKKNEAAKDLSPDKVRKETINRQLEDVGIGTIRRANKIKSNGVGLPADYTRTRWTNKGRYPVRPVLDTTNIQKAKTNKKKQKSKLWK